MVDICIWAVVKSAGYTLLTMRIMSASDIKETWPGPPKLDSQ